MQAHPLKTKARAIDTLLSRCRFQTLVHGDAKVANFCFARGSVAGRGKAWFRMPLRHLQLQRSTFNTPVVVSVLRTWPIFSAVASKDLTCLETRTIG